MCALLKLLEATSGDVHLGHCRRKMLWRLGLLVYAIVGFMYVNPCKASCKIEPIFSVDVLCEYGIINGIVVVSSCEVCLMFMLFRFNDRDS